MNEQKQIEEIQAILPNIEVVKAMYGDFDLAKLLYDRDVRKIPEGAVVLMKEGYDELLRRETKAFIKGEKQGSKETVEKIMNDISSDILVINTKEYGNIEVVPLDRISEICENILKGGKQ